MSRSLLKFRNVVPAAKVSMLIGQCVPSVKSNASKIKVKRLVLDQNLLMYFNQNDFVYVTDPEKKCKPGDIVLMEKLPENLTKLVSHRVLKIVHMYGDIVDPITGKKVMNSQYRDEVEEATDLYGRLPSTFDYNKAPPRGWQENKKDFTVKPTYTKYHVFPEEDPYAL